MPRRGNIIPQVTLDTDAAANLPLYRQLYDHLRLAILSGQYTRGSALPSTRLLAENLGISRTTVINAYEQLLAEGYLEGIVGAGTYVAHVMPDNLTASIGVASADTPPQAPRNVAKRAEFLKSTGIQVRPGQPTVRPFQVGIPALDEFPVDDWRRIVMRCYQTLPTKYLSYGELAGYGPLREAISRYLSVSRAVKCSPEQIFIVTSARQAIDLATRVLIDPGEKVWMEDPGFLGARGALHSADASLIPVPVDAEGLDVAEGIRVCPDARMAYVTPSHQFPLGITMSLARRLALLEWANQNGVWILEDDYDSEYRYAGRPLPSLQGLDTGQRVLYMGTFSKVLFPALRLAYMVVPSDLVDSFVALRALTSGSPATLEQAALAEFISEGHFERHIRRMRKLYAKRQEVLLDAARCLEACIRVDPADAGMYVIGWLTEGMDDRELAAKAADRGIWVQPLSPFGIKPVAQKAVMLGYTAFDEEAIQEGIHTLTNIVSAHNCT
jgi:GntR family transcriptional regulator/MocR family aminotransferase